MPCLLQYLACTLTQGIFSKSSVTRALNNLVQRGDVICHSRCLHSHSVLTSALHGAVSLWHSSAFCSPLSHPPPFRGTGSLCLPRICFPEDRLWTRPCQLTHEHTILEGIHGCHGVPTTHGQEHWHSSQVTWVPWQSRAGGGGEKEHRPDHRENGVPASNLPLGSLCTGTSPFIPVFHLSQESYQISVTFTGFLPDQASNTGQMPFHGAALLLCGLIFTLKMTERS